MTVTLDGLMLDLAIMRVRLVSGLRATDADFVESEHPRRDDGEFTAGAGGTAAGSAGSTAPQGVLGTVDVPDEHKSDVSKLFGDDLAAAAGRLGGGLPAGVAASTSFSIHNGAVIFSTEFKSSDGKDVGKATRTFDPTSGVVEHTLFRVDSSQQGKGLGTAYLKNNIDAYRKAGLKTVRIKAGAENGAYAWAKLGFVPDQNSWDRLRGDLVSDKAVLSKFTPEENTSLKTLLDEKNPKGIWALADSQWGKRILSSEGWKGSFDLTDEQSYDRLTAAVNRKK